MNVRYKVTVQLVLQYDLSIFTLKMSNPVFYVFPCWVNRELPSTCIKKVIVLKLSLLRYQDFVVKHEGPKTS